MLFFKRIRIHSYEVGLHFKEDEFKGLFGQGRHWLFDPLRKHRVDIVSTREPQLNHDKLDLIVKSGALKDCAAVLDLNDHQRGLVWIDGRFSRLVGPGLHAWWTGACDVRTEVVDIRQPRLEHADLKVITASLAAPQMLDICRIQRDRAGVLFVDGRYTETLRPGLFAFWKGSAEALIVEVDLRETEVNVTGQEIMTADKVSIRMNAALVYKVCDARKSVSVSNDLRQTMYREAQLALRAVIGCRDLDAVLAEKDAVVEELQASLCGRADEVGVEILSVGIKDLILPGDMKEIMNRVTEAKKAAEANLIARREETAAIRSQANSAKLLADNPTLMRLRELEILEKIASAGNLNVMLGEKGLAERVISLL